ncbi:DUF418 domain-containing protein [Svornostia abyssi]|uniref:DUF418 domain-containing protein n=1 Tax=Svornostia abyssi TaxID=2898438 RepID=A0ABY5PJX1_9ACTN|nr:DUF418 domain-containing protein [Parviterribacteraceae bacterium J379]
MTRVLAADALRGLALFGICMVNVWYFAHPLLVSGVASPVTDTTTGDATRFVIGLVFEGKFYPLFAFLFGYSFALMREAVAREGADFERRMRRRLWGLFFIGVVHGMVFWPGDILTTYAILGFVLLAWRPRRPVRTAAVLIGIATLFWAVVGTAWDTIDVVEDALLTVVSYQGTPGTVLAEHAGTYLSIGVTVLLGQGPTALAMMLLGLLAADRRLLSDPAANAPLLRRMLVVGLPVGLAGSLVYAVIMQTEATAAGDALAFGLLALTGPALTGAYIALALRWFARPGAGAAVMAWLTPAGRMALTNYVGQSVLLGVVFTAYGFEQVEKRSPPAVVAVVCAIFAVQLVVSRWWMAGHAFGPLEWVLRAWTRQTRPPWRRVVT